MKGAAAMSVEMCAVTEIEQRGRDRGEHDPARRIAPGRRRLGGLPQLRIAVRRAGARSISQPHHAISTISTMNSDRPAAASAGRAWSAAPARTDRRAARGSCRYCSPHRGSTGSPRLGWSVRANQACSSGPLADSAKNGRPIDTREQAEQPERGGRVGRRTPPPRRDRERQEQRRGAHHHEVHDDRALARQISSSAHAHRRSRRAAPPGRTPWRPTTPTACRRACGSTILVNIGCTANSSAADRKIAAAKTRRRTAGLVAHVVVRISRFGSGLKPVRSALRGAHIPRRTTAGNHAPFLITASGRSVLQFQAARGGTRKIAHKRMI